MGLFFRLFEPGIPWQLAVSVILIAFITSCIVRIVCNDGSRKRILTVWIVACLFLMLYSTVLGRVPRESVSIHLTPFWSLGAIKDGLIEVLYEKIYNVLFFIPYGILLGLYHTHNYAKAILFGLLTSIGIEFLQLITRTGMCETDDVICNTLGCAIGAGTAQMVQYIWSKWFKR